MSKSSKRIRVMIVEDEEKLRKSMLEFFGGCKEVDICGFFGSGLNIEYEIKRLKPDVLITDFLAISSEGTKVLNSVSKIEKEKPKIIVTSHTDSISVLEESFRIGADYYIKKPLIFSLLKDAIFIVCKDKSANISYDMDLKLRTRKLLKACGIPANILGYTYIEESISYLNQVDKIVFMSEVYGVLSEKYNTSVKCIEVSIRNAIKKAKKISNDEFKKIFDFCDGNPGNSIFISTLREKLMIEKIDI